MTLRHAGGATSSCSGVPVFFSYFDLYPYERHLDLVFRAAASPRASVYSLGQTLQGRDLECVKVGEGPLQVWVIHRQHPGESQASFFAEGLLMRILGLESNGRVDGLVARLLKVRRRSARRRESRGGAARRGARRRDAAHVALSLSLSHVEAASLCV